MEEHFRTSRGVFYCGNVLEVLKELEEESVDVVVTSPPYWGKVVYSEGTEAVYGGLEDCSHEWVVGRNPFTKVGEVGHQDPKRRSANGRPDAGRFCRRCGAWYGQLGLEPTPGLFVEHLLEVFDLVKRVLKKRGNLFVNVDDTWTRRSGRAELGGIFGFGDGYVGGKSLALVPELFAVRMVYERGWLLREKVVWAKKVWFYKDDRMKGNAKPEPVEDRFVHGWEYVFHFVKNRNYFFNWRAVAPRSIDGSKRVRPVDVVQINVRPFRGGHVAVFPPELPGLFIRVGSPEGGTVLDPFAGSGTALVVAEKLGRNWVGIEINKRYCEVAKKRFEREFGRDVFV